MRSRTLLAALLLACTVLGTTAAPTVGATEAKPRITTSVDVYVRVPHDPEGGVTGGFRGITLQGTKQSFIRGTVKGFSSPVKVRLQTRAGGPWKTVASQTTGGKYHLRVPTSATGTLTVRVVASRTRSRTMQVVIVPRDVVWPTVSYVGSACIQGKDGYWRWVSTWEATGGVYVDDAANSVPGSQYGLIEWVPVTSAATTRTWKSSSSITTSPGETARVSPSIYPDLESFPGAVTLSQSADYHPGYEGPTQDLTCSP